MSVQRKSSPSPTSPAAESDLETTAELPVLDVAAYEAATTPPKNGLVNTDTWIIQSPLARESTGALRSTGRCECRCRRCWRLRPSSVVDESRALDDRRLHDDRRTHDEKRAALEANLHGLSDNLREVEERLKRKGERLAEIETCPGPCQAERAVAEQHSQQLTAELAKARAAVAVTEARVTELQGTLDEREAVNETLRSHDAEFEVKLALRDKSLALVQRDLTAAHESGGDLPRVAAVDGGPAEYFPGPDFDALPGDRRARRAPEHARWATHRGQGPCERSGIESERSGRSDHQAREGSQQSGLHDRAARRIVARNNPHGR